MHKITGMKRHIAMITMLLPWFLAYAQGKDALVSEDTTNMTATNVRQGTNLNVLHLGGVHVVRKQLPQNANCQSSGIGRQGNRGARLLPR